MPFCPFCFSRQEKKSQSLHATGLYLGPRDSVLASNPSNHPVAKDFGASTYDRNIPESIEIKVDI